MTVEGIELVRVSVPLVRPFRTSFGVQHARDVLLVHVRGDGHDGWGECVAPSAPVYSEEYVDGVALVLRQHLVPRLLASDRPSVSPADGPSTITAQRVHTRLAPVRGHRMARAALEAAVLDVQLRAVGRSLARYLGAVVDRVPAGVSVGIPDGGIAALLDQVVGYLDEGYVRVKAKIAPGWDVAPIRALRERFGDEMALQVDANAAYDPDDPEHVAVFDALDELGLVLFEQPFAPDRLRDHARLAPRWATPLCLDESITDPIRTRDAIESGATAIVNIKPGRVGGLLPSVQIRDVCRERGIPVWCGGMLETGIGRAANVALAALDGFGLPGDTSASSRYYAHDLTEPFVLRDGYLDVPTGPGIGRAPDPAAMSDAKIVRLHG